MNYVYDVSSNSDISRERYFYVSIDNLIYVSIDAILLSRQQEQAYLSYEPSRSVVQGLWKTTQATFKYTSSVSYSILIMFVDYP